MKLFSALRGSATRKSSLQDESQPLQCLGVYAIELSYEQTSFRLWLDIYATAAAFSTQIYLATGVIPSRQNIIGFQVLLYFVQKRMLHFLANKMAQNFKSQIVTRFRNGFLLFRLLLRLEIRTLCRQTRTSVVSSSRMAQN